MCGLRRSERGIKRLAVTRIPASGLKPVPHLEGEFKTVKAESSLRDALAALLEGGTGWVGVERDGRVAEVMYLEDIYTSLRAAAA